MKNIFSFICNILLLIAAASIFTLLINNQNAWLIITIYWFINSIKIGYDVFKI